MAGREALTPEQYAAWREQVGLSELCQILFWRWDPIAVAFAFPRTANEYDDYARVLLSRLQGGVSPEEIAAYLEKAETDAMGVRASPSATRLDVSNRITAWVDDSIDRWIADRAGTSAGDGDVEPEDDPRISWFAVRRVFRFHETTYEERVTVWRAASFEEADRLAEAEAVEYAELAQAHLLAFSQLYRAGETPKEGSEVFSLLRDSDLEPDDYLDHFFNDGEERQGTLE
jgi:hypothetical protein